MINWFDTVRVVVERGIDSYCEGHNIGRNKAVQEIREHLVANSAQYFSDDPSIDYASPLCRLGYLFCYVAAHANLLENSLFKCEALKQHLIETANSQGTLRICDFGGGPGSELLGFVKFFERNLEHNPEAFVNLDFTVIDNTVQWSESWEALVEAINDYLSSAYSRNPRKWPVSVGKTFIPHSLVDPATYSDYSSLFNKDLFVFHHIVSELLADKDDFAAALSHVVAGAPSGSRFLVIDRAEKSRRIEKVASEIFAFAGLPLPPASFQYEEASMDLDERKTSLSTLIAELSRKPKLTWKAFFCLVRKDS